MEDTKSNPSEAPPESVQDSAREHAQRGSMEELEALTTQLNDAEHAVAEMRETMLRERADVENQRRRLQRDLEQARRFANERLLGDMLPVCDSLEQGLAARTGDAEALREGMQLTLKSLLKVVQDNGLQPIDPLHQPFDPEMHQAMNMVATDEHAPGIVIAVMQKGYVLNERLLRPALVTVSKAVDE